MNAFPADAFVSVHAPRSVPDVSVLMPLFEQQRWAGAAIASVLAQREVSCEVVISDDASSDGTFASALASVEAALRAQPDLRHQIVMRRGTRRLARDHLLLLTRHAACDVVAWAHGDDVSSPLRMRVLLDALEARGAALAASTYSLQFVDGTGFARRVLRRVRQPRRSWPALRGCSLRAAVQGRWWLVASTQAWRRSALAHFPPMSSSYLSAGHDRLLPIRAAVSGGIVAIGVPLVHRIEHGSNWSSLAPVGLDPDTAARTREEIRAEVLQVACGELAWAASAGLVESRVVAQLRRELTSIKGGGLVPARRR